jgi:hypothetical protein
VGGARALQVNITIVTTKFLYDHILTWFGCLLTIVIDHNTHFINDVIHYLINHFIWRHSSYFVYYPQRNGQVESINKSFSTHKTSE